MTHGTDNEFEELLAAATEAALSEAEARRLEELLSSNPELQDVYARYMALHAWLTWERPSAARDVGGQGGETPQRTSLPASPVWKTPRRLIHSVAESMWHPVALLLVVGFVSTGILAYVFSTSPPQQPVAKQPLPASAAKPVAKLVGTTDAIWAGPISPAGNSLKPGERLILKRGSAEIAFNSQARVILEGPAEFTIVDAKACRLAEGKLTAHVPEPARGFKVHTPTSTVTDLGTEFGVYVGSETGGGRFEDAGEEEQQPGGGQQQAGSQPPITEVHVFKGQVDVAPGDQLDQAAGQENPPPQSEIRNQKSKILSAGQAATISENKVQPLPAADPFKFALDKLQGKPRTVLLTEDFETYELGKADKAIGPWLVQGTFRKGQGVAVIDPAATIAQLLAERDISIPNASPSPANGQRVAKCVSAMELPKDTYPLLAREIDCREFARRCQVLVEFDLFTQGQWTEPSLAFAAEVGQAPGIALWQNSDAAAPKIEWQPNRWYRVRVLLDVADGAVRSVRAERSLWAGAEGWVRDWAFTPPIPQVEWKTPPRYVIFGFPVPPTGKSGGHYWLDNIRVEAIGETTKFSGAGTEKTLDNPK